MERGNPSTLTEKQRMTNEEREKMILDMLPAVKYRALRIFANINRSVELEELISAGTMGLLEAVDRFDESKGVKFQTYADLRIEGAIKDSLRKLDWASRSQRHKKKMYESTFNRLYERLNRNPSEEEMAHDLGLDEKEWKKFIGDVIFIQIGSFTEIQNESDDNAEIRFIPEDEEGRNPYYQFEKKELIEILSDEIRKLSEKETLVLSLYYYDELNMKEIGMILGVTESRVSQLHNQAVLRIKGRLKSVAWRRKQNGMNGHSRSEI